MAAPDLCRVRTADITAPGLIIHHSSFIISSSLMPIKYQFFSPADAAKVARLQLTAGKSSKGSSPDGTKARTRVFRGILRTPRIRPRR